MKFFDIFPLDKRPRTTRITWWFDLFCSIDHSWHLFCPINYRRMKRTNGVFSRSLVSSSLRRWWWSTHSTKHQSFIILKHQETLLLYHSLLYHLICNCTFELFKLFFNSFFSFLFIARFFFLLLLLYLLERAFVRERRERWKVMTVNISCLNCVP